MLSKRMLSKIRAALDAFLDRKARERAEGVADAVRRAFDQVQMEYSYTQATPIEPLTFDDANAIAREAIAAIRQETAELMALELCGDRWDAPARHNKHYHTLVNIMRKGA